MKHHDPKSRPLFEHQLLCSFEDLRSPLTAFEEIPWAEFLLNPRRLRGSDFLMRWSQGRWSEDRLIQAVNSTGRYLAVPYGPSGTAPDDDPRAFELYFERLETAGLSGVKRPDLLVFPASERSTVNEIVEELGGAPELPFRSEQERRMQQLLDRAVLAIECENSLWKASMMPAYGQSLRPMARMGGLPGLPKNAVVPTVILKDEDIEPLVAWQSTHGVPIHIWHVFFDMAFGLALDDARRLIEDGLISSTDQVFQAPGGATTSKSIYKIYYHYTYELGQSIEEPVLKADSITDKNGHILPYVRFEGGTLELSEAALEKLSALKGRKKKQRN